MQKIKKLLKIVFSREFILQVIKFGIAGGTTSIIDWGVLAICVRVLHMDSMVSNIFAFAISVTYNYWANAKFVFDFDESKGKKRVFILFVCLAAVGFAINQIVMYLGNKVLCYALPLSLVTLIVVSLLTKAPAPEHIERCFRRH